MEGEGRSPRVEGEGRSPLRRSRLPWALRSLGIRRRVPPLSACTSLPVLRASEGSDDAELPLHRTGSNAPSTLTLTDDADLDHGFSHFSFAWNGNDRAIADAADDAAAAALLGVASDENTNDPVLIEKKIRAVQKKLRRVQTIEELVAQGSSLDTGQQVARAPPSSEGCLHG